MKNKQLLLVPVAFLIRIHPEGGNNNRPRVNAKASRGPSPSQTAEGHQTINWAMIWLLRSEGMLKRLVRKSVCSALRARLAMCSIACREASWGAAA
jgi:hypothetical protein